MLDPIEINRDAAETMRWKTEEISLEKTPRRHVGSPLGDTNSDKQRASEGAQLSYGITHGHQLARRTQAASSVDGAVFPFPVRGP